MPALPATHRRLIFLTGVAPVLLAAGLALYRPAAIARLDNAAYDALVRMVPPKPQSGGVVVVDIDERSLAAVGQWPWRRDVVGRLIARLRAAGTSAVALDIIFAEADRQSLPPMSDEDAARTPDDMLARTLQEGRVVLGYAATFDAPPAARRPCLLHPVRVTTVQRGSQPETAYFRATDAVCSLPLLAEAAGASGFLNAVPDSDGLLRRVPLLVELDGQVYPSLALAAYVTATGARAVTLRRENVNRSTLWIDDTPVPLDGRANALVRFRGKKNTIRYVSAADVMAGTLPSESLRGVIAFVGTTALGTREVVSIPLDTRFTGVEIQATVADNLLQRDFFGRSAFATMFDSLVALVLGIGVAAVVTAAGLTVGAAASLGAVGTVWGLSFWKLSGAGVYISPVPATIGPIAAFGLMTIAKFAAERLRAESAGRERTNTQRLMVQTLLSLTETRDLETGRHSRRTQQYARLLASQAAATNPAFAAFLTPDRIELLSSLAPLHDIGKVGVPDHILNKPGRLTPEELVEMRRHPTLGRDVILKAEQQSGISDDATMQMAKDIVYTHHERWDGTGYPQGLKGLEIPVPGRIMAVVDVFDAISTRTLYRAPMPHTEAVQHIIDGAGTHFDPAVVAAFVTVAPAFKAVAEEAVAEEEPSQRRQGDRKAV